MDISIIIVNYNTPHLVINCISSFYKNFSRIRAEFLVVDNASHDNSKQLILEAFPSIRWIQMSYNSGFARANNIGILSAKGRVVLLLNSDTLDSTNTIENCFYAFVSSAYVACGVQLLNADGSPQISGNYIITGGLNNLLPLPYVGATIKWLGNLLHTRKPNIPDAKTEVEVDWINGAFLMVKKSVIEKAGLLDEDFFLYAEEAEWCSRLKKYGKLCIYGQFNIIHLQGETSNKTFGSTSTGYHNLYDKKGLQIMLSSFVRIRKEFGVGWFFFQLFIYLITVPLLFFLSFIDNLFHLRNPFHDYNKAYGFLKNMLTIVRYSPKIYLNKPYFYKVL
ncbi:MAG: glycosyltransferase family 2 protein [Agriterribacter sp.]